MNGQDMTPDKHVVTKNGLGLDQQAQQQPRWFATEIYISFLAVFSQLH